MWEITDSLDDSEKRTLLYYIELKAELDFEDAFKYIREAFAAVSIGQFIKKASVIKENCYLTSPGQNPEIGKGHKCLTF